LVTEIDRRAETMIVNHLLHERPDHGAFGEEHGPQGELESPWQWVIDPIDGTSGFVRGIPIWATLIALVHAERGALLGVVSAPALGRRGCPTPYPRTFPTRGGRRRREAGMA